MKKLRVIVAGLGAMGSAAAAELSARGADVVGLEQFTPAHDLGSSHGESRIFRVAYFEDSRYVPLLQRALVLWRELERRAEAEVFQRVGALLIGAEQSEIISGAVHSAEQWSLPHELMTSAECRGRFPKFKVRDHEVALLEAQAGILRPERAILAFQNIAAQSGANLRFHESIRTWKADQGGVSVTTNVGEYKADRLIITPGAWAPQLLGEWSANLSLRRVVQYWFRPRGQGRGWLPGGMPAYIWAPGDYETFYGLPALAGISGGAKVAYHQVGPIIDDPGQINRQVSDAEIEQMRRPIAELIPELNGEVVGAKSCIYTNTPDEHFIVGIHPDSERVALAAGFSGHGFKFASVMGEILAELAVQGGTRHDISLFEPSRFK